MHSSTPFGFLWMVLFSRSVSDVMPHQLLVALLYTGLAYSFLQVFSRDAGPENRKNENQNLFSGCIAAMGCDRLLYHDLRRKSLLQA